MYNGHCQILILMTSLLFLLLFMTSQKSSIGNPKHIFWLDTPQNGELIQHPGIVLLLSPDWDLHHCWSQTDRCITASPQTGISDHGIFSFTCNYSIAQIPKLIFNLKQILVLLLGINLWALCWLVNCLPWRHMLAPVVNMYEDLLLALISGLCLSPLIFSTKNLALTAQRVIQIHIFAYCYNMKIDGWTREWTSLCCTAVH